MSLFSPLGGLYVSISPPDAIISFSNYLFSELVKSLMGRYELVPSMFSIDEFSFDLPPNIDALGETLSYCN